MAEPSTGYTQRLGMTGTEPTINFTIPEWCVSLNSQSYLSDSQDQTGARAIFNLYLTQAEMSGLIALSGSTGNTGTNDPTLLGATGSHQFAGGLTGAAHYIKTALQRQQVQSNAYNTLGLSGYSLANSFICVKSDFDLTDKPWEDRNLIEEYLLCTTKSLFNNVDAFSVTSLQSRYKVASELYNLGNKALLNMVLNNTTPDIATRIVDEITSKRIVTNQAELFIEGDVLSFTIQVNPPPMQSRIIAGASIHSRTYVFNIVCNDTKASTVADRECTQYNSTVASQPLLPDYTNVNVLSDTGPVGPYVDTQGCVGYQVSGESGAFGTQFGVTGYTPDNVTVN